MTAVCQGLSFLFALLVLAPAPRYEIQHAPVIHAQQGARP
jgi:hypothetical protein